MSWRDDGGGMAFPCHPDDDILGMNMRDYFAARALNGILASHQSYGALAMDAPTGGWAVVARRAYAIADAMLTEREKGMQT